LTAGVLLLGVEFPSILGPAAHPWVPFATLQVLQAQPAPGDSPQVQDIALLVRGPVEDRGLPFLRSNVIDHYFGSYSYLGKSILVYYTEREIVRYETWQLVDCGGGTRLYRLDETLMDRYRAVLEASGERAFESTGKKDGAGKNEAPVNEAGKNEAGKNEAGKNEAPTAATADKAAPRAVFFYEDQDYYLFFAFEDELNCTFVRRFLTRFEYFRSVQDLPSKRPPFPAVVD
jgi:hypothetical protein